MRARIGQHREPEHPAHADQLAPVQDAPQRRDGERHQQKPHRQVPVSCTARVQGFEPSCPVQASAARISAGSKTSRKTPRRRPERRPCRSSHGNHPFMPVSPSTLRACDTREFGHLSHRGAHKPVSLCRERKATMPTAVFDVGNVLIRWDPFRSIAR